MSKRRYTNMQVLLPTIEKMLESGKNHRDADMGQRWMLIAKLSVTDYFDRDHISSGLQQIDRSSKADLEFQLRLKL